MLYEKSEILKLKGEKMKTDLYTKTMLTLIVLFLGILSFDKVYDSFIQKVEAHEKEDWRCWSETELHAQRSLNLWKYEQIEMVRDGEMSKMLFICGKRP
jgi:hypothetical protein